MLLETLIGFRLFLLQQKLVRSAQVHPSRVFYELPDAHHRDKQRKSEELPEHAGMHHLLAEFELVRCRFGLLLLVVEDRTDNGGTSTDERFERVRGRKVDYLVVQSKVAIDNAPIVTIEISELVANSGGDGARCGLFYCDFGLLGFHDGDHVDLL